MSFTVQEKKDRKAARDKKYHLRVRCNENQEQRQERLKRQREAHRRYAKKHPELLRERLKIARSGGRYTESSLRWRRARGDWYRNYMRDWEIRNRLHREQYRKSHRVEALIRYWNHEIKKRGTSDGSITVLSWKNRINDFQGLCVYCHSFVGNSAHMDHVKPLSRGGTHVITNVVPACEFCNKSKGAKNVLDWKPYFAGGKLWLENLMN